ncbi:MAG: helix-turn-helix transcriptional regulator [Alistipes timonensis]|nr:helix-turn-helix transcriptional regulator [Alistipes timonensis]
MKSLELQENLKKYTRLADCPVRNVIARFSGKWSMLVLCVLAENESTRFNAIGKAIPDISPKVLTETLRNLERDHLVARMVYSEIPPRVEYSLTEVGRSLIPLIADLVAWANTNYAAITSR